MTRSTDGSEFHGWRVVAAAFAIAVFGWGLGFYGPAVYLHSVRQSQGWPVSLVSAAVTLHFLAGAGVVVNLPRLYRRFGLPAVTRGGAGVLALGLVGWSTAASPLQLLGAALVSGAGWVTLGAAAINAMVAPWFVALRPRALSTAYNGASVGGIVFPPLLVAGIASIGFPATAFVVGAAALAVVWILTGTVLAATPEQLGQRPDGGAASAAGSVAATPAALPGPALWRNFRFRTLAAGMALGLFAQIGLVAHLFSITVPTLGPSLAAAAMGLATASAIAGRTGFGWLMPAGADRRRVAALSYAIQIAGCAALFASGGRDVALILLGTALFGFGIGNATSLPPLIAQAEFDRADVARVVPAIVAIAQAAYAFAPAAFGVIRELAAAAPAVAVAPDYAVCIAAGVVKLLAILCLLAGRRRRTAASG